MTSLSRDLLAIRSVPSLCPQIAQIASTPLQWLTRARSHPMTRARIHRASGMWDRNGQFVASTTFQQYSFGQKWCNPGRQTGSIYCFGHSQRFPPG